MNTRIRKTTRRLIRKVLSPQVIATAVTALVIGGVIRLVHDGVIVSAITPTYETSCVIEEPTFTVLPNGDILLPNSLGYDVVYTPYEESVVYPEQPHQGVIVVKDADEAFYEEDWEFAVEHDEDETQETAELISDEDEVDSSREIEISDADRFLLERICLAEAGVEPWDAKVGVVNTILNRVEQDPKQFGHDIEHVIYKEGQYSPVEGWDICFWDDNGEYRAIVQSDIPEEVKRAVQAALDGENPVGDRCYFYSERWISDKELAARSGITDTIQYGDTVFHNWPDE